MSGRHTANEEHPARINYFAYHYISVQLRQHNILLFSASFFKAHPSRHMFGKPVTLWECDLFESYGNFSILPIQFIKYRTVSLIDKVNHANAVLVSTIIQCTCMCEVIFSAFKLLMAVKKSSRYICSQLVLPIYMSVPCSC